MTVSSGIILKSIKSNKTMRKDKKISSILFAGLILVLIVFIVFCTGCTPKTNVNLYFAKYEDNLAYLVPEVQAYYQ